MLFSIIIGFKPYTNLKEGMAEYITWCELPRPEGQGFISK